MAVPSIIKAAADSQGFTTSGRHDDERITTIQYVELFLPVYL